MIKTIVKIDGMMCGMCEAHVNDAIRNHFEVKKVKVSNEKGSGHYIRTDVRFATDERCYRRDRYVFLSMEVQ